MTVYWVDSRQGIIPEENRSTGISGLKREMMPCHSTSTYILSHQYTKEWLHVAHKLCAQKLTHLSQNLKIKLKNQVVFILTLENPRGQIWPLLIAATQNEQTKQKLSNLTSGPCIETPRGWKQEVTRSYKNDLFTNELETKYTSFVRILLQS